MNSKATKSSSFIQCLLDKYIYYVVINKSHKKYIIDQLGNRQSNQSKLGLA